MTRDIVNINDYIILVEESHAQQTTIDACVFDEPLIAVAFYGEGDVDLTVKYGDTQKDYQHTKGLALSFYADDHVQFIHTISALKSLQCIVVATSISNLQALPNHEGELFTQLLHELVHPSDHFVEGPNFFMSPAMLGILDQVFNNGYEGKTKMMFFRSQMTALLAHFFGHLASTKTSTIKAQEREKLYEAKEILSNNLEAPPSLSELSKQIGLNSFKLKKNFKALFGVPVFKYLFQKPACLSVNLKEALTAGY